MFLLLFGHASYLGSRPELARNDSQTFIRDQHIILLLHTYIHMLTDLTNFKAVMFENSLVDVRRMMSLFRSAVTHAPRKLDRGGAEFVGELSAHSARHLLCLTTRDFTSAIL